MEISILQLKSRMLTLDAGVNDRKIIESLS